MVSVFDIFKIGIGPSSSHTIGPMKAALSFVDLIQNSICWQNPNLIIKIHLFGSLALTGEGHGTIPAIVNGLSGKSPSHISTIEFIDTFENVKKHQTLNLNGNFNIQFNLNLDIILHKQEFLLQHANGMRFVAILDNQEIISKDYFSIGGGFVKTKEQLNMPVDDEIKIPYPFKTAKQLFELAKLNNLSIAQIINANELVTKNQQQIHHNATEVIECMFDSIARGLNTTGVLPGGLNVNRRACNLYNKINAQKVNMIRDKERFLAVAYAMAVNEENAAFGKIVTAPTNGAAGTIPSVLKYFKEVYNPTKLQLIDFLFTAGAIGMLYKYGASISAAEVGCQGEIGVACSMASGALASVLGGTLIQIEKAAEIAMEHNLGMTCDPVAGLVQIPCIERNGVASTKAIDIANIALLEDQPGLISLDKVIVTMLQTGRDMNTNYKETSLGGLAVNIINC